MRFTLKENLEEKVDLVKEPAEETVEEAVEADKKEMSLEECTYRKYANLDESAEINELDDWAVTQTAAATNKSKTAIRKQLLGEDVSIGDAAAELEAEAVETKDEIEDALDRALKIARRKARNHETSDFPNILLEGQAGTGKTEIVRAWAQKNGINLVQKNLGTMGVEAFGGIMARDMSDPRYGTRLGTNELIRDLSKPNSVLFLDEYNRSRTDVRGAVLTLVQNHMVWDPTTETGERYLENFLFTVAAMNPSGSSYIGTQKIDPAEQTRFRKIPVTMNPLHQLKYLKSFYTKAIEDAGDDKEERLEMMGKLALAEKILSSSSFTFDTVVDEEKNEDDPSYIPLNYRSFKRVLDDCDGTKDDLLALWNGYCNYKKKPMIETILSDYVDVEDKANDALAQGTDSPVFASRKRPSDILRSAGLID